MKAILNTIESVKGMFPSLFTKEDVVKILTDLQPKAIEEVLQMTSDAVEKVQGLPSGKKMKTKYDMEDFYTMARRAVKCAVGNLDKDCIDSTDFEIEGGNEIVLSSVEFDEDAIVGDIMDEIEREMEDILELEEVEEDED